MQTATFTNRPGVVAVTQLRIGRLLLLLAVATATAVGGGLWLLRTQGHPLTPPVAESTGGPAWLQQTQTYPVAEPKATPAPPPAPDLTAAELAKLRAQLAEQQQAIDELKRRPKGQPMTPAPTKTSTSAKGHPPLLYVSHEVKETPPTPKATEYTLAPGATKLPCVIETAMNSDVEGYFTARVSTNVYDTATGRHLLVPQGSTILGHDQSSTLLYGNERLPTVSVTLALPDGRSVDLGQAPVTDQQGVAGLTGKVDQHFWRLVGAVVVGGALRGGQQALQMGTAQAGGVGQVVSGVGAVASQAGQQRAGRALDTRPTIRVASGQLCHVLLLKPLALPAMWQ